MLGIDYGSKRIGVALGDTDSKIASPWKVIEHDGQGKFWNEIQKLVLEEKIDTLVVGIPRPLQDREYQNNQVQEIRAFIEELRGRGYRIEEIDEALSSKMAAIYVKDRGEKGKRDDLAATVILQSWLEKM